MTHHEDQSLNDESLVSLEAELELLSPKMIDLKLSQKVAAGLHEATGPVKPVLMRQKRPRNAMSMILAIAASFMVVFTAYQYFHGQNLQGQDPVYSKTTHQYLWDQGPVTVANARHDRQALRQTVQTQRWKDPERGVRIEYVIPQENVITIDLSELSKKAHSDRQIQNAVSMMAQSRKWSSYQDGQYHVVIHSVDEQFHVMVKNQQNQVVLFDGLASQGDWPQQALPEDVKAVIPSLMNRDAWISNDPQTIKKLLKAMKNGAKVRMHIVDRAEISKIKGK